MLDHVSLPVRDLSSAGAFYDRVLATLGIARISERPGAIGYAAEGDPPEFWLVPRGPAGAGPGRGLHLSFRASSPARVLAFHRVALELGAKDAGAPGERPHYSGSFYGFVIDPEGYKIEATCRLASPRLERSGADIRNAFGQPIGEPVPDWTPRPLPPRTPMEGRFCRVERLDCERHAAALHEVYALDAEGRNWTYLPYGPFRSVLEYQSWVKSVQADDATLFHAIVDLASGAPLGVAAYLRIDPAMGSIEVGHLSYSPALQRTRPATEAMYLMMRRAIEELGYRRYEWKCDSRNAPSMKAAERLGFRYEGSFRQAVVMKGRTRDTAWFSVLDSEWPALRAAFEAWLDPGNFDASGKQRTGLTEIRVRQGGSA